MSAAWDDMVVVGRIARAHGIRGQVVVDPVTDFPDDRFKAGSIVFYRKGDAIEPLTITAARIHRGRPIIGVAGVETMTAAEELAGTELRINVDALQPLPPGSFYQHDLVGCLVETTEGMAIGTVASVEGAGVGSRLVIPGANGGEILIPLAAEIVVGVNLDARTIVVQPPEGLLDVNVPRRQKF